MPFNINKYFVLIKLVIISTLFVIPLCLSAKEYSVEYIINLEKRLNTLKSEIYITRYMLPDNYKKQNSALYYFQKKSWRKGLDSILPDTVFTPECKDYINILYGISMQGFNKKRAALHYYNKVSLKSSHYAEAQLNVALLYMHDGRINKTFNTIKKILTNSSVILNQQIKNRLFLVLGYLNLKEKKYHESRVAFRNIEAKSIYFNRGVIGASIAALQLKDYAASQHALYFLNRKIIHDLPSDESYLALAFSYESQGEYAKATVFYENAVEYYKKRIKNISKLIRKNKPLIIHETINKHVFIVSDNKIDLLESLPTTFFNDYYLLKKLMKKINENSEMKNNFHKRASVLYVDYRKLINQLLIKHLSIRKKRLYDYLKQSKYGLILSNDRLLSLMEASN